MADKFIALGINSALPLLKNYDVYWDKAKNAARSRSRGRGDANVAGKQGGRGLPQQQQPRPRRARSVGYDSDGYWSTDYDTEDERERGRRPRTVTTETTNYAYPNDSAGSIPPQRHEHRHGRARGATPGARPRAMSSTSSRPRGGFVQNSQALTPTRRVSFSDNDEEIPARGNELARKTGTPGPPAKRPESMSRPKSRAGSPKAQPELTGHESEDEDKQLKSEKKRNMVMTGLATVATIHAAGNIWGSVQASQERHKALKKDEITEQEARNNKLKHAAHDAASVALVGFMAKGLRARWKSTMEQRKQIAEKSRAREEKRRQKAEQDEMSDGYSTGYYTSDEEVAPTKSSRKRPGLNRVMSHSDGELPTRKGTSGWPGQQQPLGEANRRNSNVPQAVDPRSYGPYSPMPPPPMGPNYNGSYSPHQHTAPPSRSGSVSSHYAQPQHQLPLRARAGSVNDQYPRPPAAYSAPRSRPGSMVDPYGRGNMQYTAPPSRSGSIHEPQPQYNYPNEYAHPNQGVPPNGTYNAYGMPSPVSPGPTYDQTRRQSSGLSAQFFGTPPPASPYHGNGQQMYQQNPLQPPRPSNMAEPVPMARAQTLPTQPPNGFDRQTQYSPYSPQAPPQNTHYGRHHHHHKHHHGHSQPQAHYSSPEPQESSPAVRTFPPRADWVERPYDEPKHSTRHRRSGERNRSKESKTRKAFADSGWYEPGAIDVSGDIGGDFGGGD